MAGGFIGRMRAIFAGAPPADAGPVREIFLEEDEYGEIEVLPAAMADWCAGEFRKIAAFADAHQAPGGVGWTDIYLRRRRRGRSPTSVFRWRRPSRC